MNNLDLVDYTNTSYKIPNGLLTSMSEKKVSTLKILSAHLIDFYTVTGITSIFNILMLITLNQLLIVKSLKVSNYNLLNLSVEFPVMLMSYYFFSFFFNHGQTLGMKTFKIRVVLPEHSFSQSFKSSFQSMALIMSFGLSFKFLSKNQTFTNEDYLYTRFLAHKDLSPINLLEEIKKSKNKNLEVPYKIAA